jgi:creatine kinase
LGAGAAATASTVLAKQATVSFYPDANDDFPDLTKHNNYMANLLTRDIYRRLKSRVTPSGVTIDQCIQTGVDNPGHPFILTVGMTAGDEESYDVFAEIFDPVIEARHGGYPKDGVHKQDLDYTKIKEQSFDENYVLSTRVRTGRSIRGFRLAPQITRAERREVERLIDDCASKFTGELAGKYRSLTEMGEKEHERLIDEHLMYDKPVSPLLVCSGMARDWPDGRGMFMNAKKTFLLWVNEEDHLRVVSMQKGGNIREVFQRFCVGLKTLEDEMKRRGREYMFNDHLGYILTCPSNLGTGLRAGVHVKLPNVSKHPQFKKILTSMRLQSRGTGGVDTAAVGGIVDISNSDRLGRSEVELVQAMVDGVNKLIEFEKILEKGGSIDGKK